MIGSDELHTPHPTDRRRGDDKRGPWLEKKFYHEKAIIQRCEAGT